MENRKLTVAASFKKFLYKYSEDSKICLVLHRVLDGVNFKGTAYRQNRTNILTDNFCNYLNFRKNGFIGYLPNGKECIYTEYNEWKKDNRQEGKPAKVIRKFFTERAAKMLFCDTDFEIFANLAKKEFNVDGYTIEVLSRHHIKDIYGANICEGNGSLNSSCMNGDIGYLDIYENCSKLQILALWNKAKELCGRALLWEFRTGEFFMDRIYTVKDFEFEYFLDYAKQNKYWYKLHYKSYDNKTLWINPNNDEVEEMKVTIITDCYLDEFPYIDTFSYGDDDSLNNFGNGHYVYNNTNGTRDGDDNHNNNSMVFCSYNRTEYDEDDCTYISSTHPLQYDECYIHNDDVVEAIMPNGYVEYVCVNDNMIVEVVGRRQIYHCENSDIVCVGSQYYHIDDDYIVYCDETSEYELHENCVYITSDGEYYLLDSNSIVKLEDCYDEYYLKTDEEVVCIEGEYFHTNYHDGKLITSYVNGEGETIWYKIGDENIIEVEYLIFMDKRSEEYKQYKKAYRKNRRNKLGRKNRNKLTVKN